MLYIVSYDIPDNKRRIKLAKLLEDYGQRVQYSVFELEVSPEMFERVKREMGYLFELEEDNIRVYPICAACAKNVEKVGTAVKYAREEYLVL